MTKAKYKAFGKVTVKKKIERKTARNEPPQTKKSEKELHSVIQNKEKKRVETEKEKLRQLEVRKGKAAAIFKLKEGINGSNLHF